MIIVSTIALVFSVISIIISLIIGHNQIETNKNSLKPMCHILCRDYVDDISVNLHNYGVGPMVIENITIVKKDEISETTYTKLYVALEKTNTYLKSHRMAYADFSGDIIGRPIPANSNIFLVRISPKNDEIRKIVRKELSSLTIKVCYSDVFGTKREEIKDLMWFARTI